MRNHRTLFWLCLAALAPLGACNGNGGDDDHDVLPETEAEADAEAEAEAEVDGGDDAGEAADWTPDVPAVCMTSEATCLGPACHAAPYAVTCVGGTVTDPAGDPLYDQAVALCAADRCYFGRTDAEGWFAVRVPAAAIDDLALYFPADPPVHSPFCHFTELCDGELRLCTDFRLYPAPSPGTTIPTGALTADIRLEADDGGALVLPAGTEFCAPIGAEAWGAALTRFPLAEHVPCFIDPANPPLALYVVTPLDTYVVDPGTCVGIPTVLSAAIDLPNETGLPADTVVDIWALGGAHSLDAGLAEGEWRAYAEATVSSDGTRIVGDAGLGYLTWFGVYAR